jgi:hypothetical protein
MASRAVYPPMQHPTSPETLDPTAAQSQLAAFLSQTRSKAHLHPDALLSSTGIQFSANSGPTGGLALHHLQRIEAGLRGENLVQETQDELEAVFGEEMRAAGTLRGDDRRVDAKIERVSKRSKSQERVREWEDGTEFAQHQDITEGEVGDRVDAHVVQQGGAPPAIEQHGGKVDAAARKAAKKERRLADLRAKEEAKAKAKQED